MIKYKVTLGKFFPDRLFLDNHVFCSFIHKIFIKDLHYSNANSSASTNIYLNRKIISDDLI